MFLVLVLIRNPFVFLKAVGIAVSRLVRPGSYAKYIEDNRVLIGEAIQKGLWIVAPLSRNPITDAYARAHDTARLQLYAAGREYALCGNTGRFAWRKLFGPVTPGDHQLEHLVAVIYKMTGHLRLYAYMEDSAPRRRFVETALLFPRYIRVVVGLLLDALQGDVRGNEARRLLGSLVVTGVLLWLLLRLWIG